MAMSLIAGEGLTSEVVTMAQTGKRVGGGGCWNLLAQNGLESLNDELLDRGAPVIRCDLRAFKDVVGQVNGGFYAAINTALWPYVKDRDENDFHA